MSGELALWAARQDIKNLVAKMTLIALADSYNDTTGACFPSHQTLGEFVRRGKTQIKTALGWLEKDGWIKKSFRFAPNGRQTSNGYEIIYERGEATPKWMARRDKGKGVGFPTPSGNPTGVQAETRPDDRSKKRRPLTKQNEQKSAHPRASENLSPVKEEPPAAAPCPPSAPEPAYISDDRGWKRLEMSANPAGKGWLSNWGPPPHAAKCTTPPDVIQRYERKYGVWKEKGGYGIGSKSAVTQPKGWQPASALVN